MINHTQVIWNPHQNTLAWAIIVIKGFPKCDANNYIYLVNEALNYRDQCRKDRVYSKANVIRQDRIQTPGMSLKVLLLHFRYPEEARIECGVHDEAHNV